MYVHLLALLCFVELAEFNSLFSTGYDSIVTHNCTATLDYDNSGYKVNCSGLKLGSVPPCHRLPVNCSLVTKLILTHNSISSIPDGSFRTFSKLHVLDLSYIPLTKCKNGSFIGLYQLKGLSLTHVRPETYLWFEPDAFKTLKSLKLMNLSSSFIHKGSFFNSLCSVTPDFHTLILDNLRTFERTVLIDLNEDMSCLKRIEIKTLSMENCQIRSINLKFIQNFPKLEYVSFRKNQIMMTQSHALILGLSRHNVTYFDASCQDSAECDYAYPWANWIPNKPVIFPHLNITTYGDHRVSMQSSRNVTNSYFLPNLQTIKSHHISNVIWHDSYAPSFCWKNNHLINVDISFITALHLEDTICFDQLKFLNLRGIEKLILGVKTFHASPNLEVLLLGSANTGSFFTSKSSELLFERNTKLRFLDMSDLGLATVHSEMFKPLLNLEYLILSHNRLANVPKEALYNLVSLHHMDLSFNLFRDIPIQIILQMKQTGPAKQKYVHFGHNPFLCDCPSVRRIKEANNSNVIIEDFAGKDRNLTCLLTNRKTVTFPEALKILTPLCFKLDKVSIVFLTFLYPLLLGIILAATCGYKYRWKMQYIWYTIVGFFNPRKENSMTCFKFDAYVAYGPKDTDMHWVRTVLLPKLEYGPTRYTLKIEDRDFPVGNIAEVILAAIEESRMTILLVTKSFVRSNWCIFAARAAQAHHLIRPKRLIAIVFPGVRQILSRNVEICHILDKVTNLDWCEDEIKQSVLWMRLTRLLGTPIKKRT